jgi:hypothetical protein
VRKKRIVLEHQPKAAQMGWQRGNIRPIPQHPASIGAFQPGDDAQQGALAAAGTPQQTQYLAIAYRQREAVQ